MPKVSVIIPCYNVEKYLKECLDSVVNQTLKDIEIICINDGSTDSTLEILREYENKDKRIKVIDKENSGYGISMNKGLDVASGEYIGIVEPDDFIELYMYESLYNLATKHFVEIIKCNWKNYYTYDKHSELFMNVSMERDNTIINIENYPHIANMHPSVWAGLYKNDFLKKFGIKFLETPGASYQDTAFSFKAIVLANNIFLTKEPYLYYRQDNSNSSINSTSKVYALCNEYAEIDSFLLKYPEIKNIIEEMKWVKQFYSYKWNLERISEQYVDEFTKRFRSEFLKPYHNGILQQTFWNAIDEEYFQFLMNDFDKFKKYLKKIKCRNNRKKIISLHINKNCLEFKLFNKRKIYIDWRNKNV